MHAIAIVILCIVSAVSYGILHDQITARICVEYFTIGHPPVFDTTSPTWLLRRIQARRRPLLPITILPLFLGTSVTLVLETGWLRDYGIDLTHSVWWLPWM
jgi:hypothetical protein